MHSPVNQAYQSLLEEFSPSFKQTRHSKVSGEEVVSRFFAPGRCRQHHFDNHQEYTLEGIRGRLLSTSYAPPPEHPNHVPMLEQLESVFEAYQVDGRLRLEYDTALFLGRLT